MTLLKMFYSEVIGAEKYIEIRCFRKDGMVFSKYFDDVGELLEFVQMNKNKYNLFVGVNPRQMQGRKLENIKNIKNIVFDIEKIKGKTPLWENGEWTEYAEKLKTTVQFVQEYLTEKYQLYATAVVVSGRGLHMYVTLNEGVDVKEYKQKYSQWYKSVMKYINENSPHHHEIKCDVMVKDPTRIFGAPGSVNNKYPEKPERKIIYYKKIGNNKLCETLDKLKNYNAPTTGGIYKGKRKYTEENLFFSPEFKVFEYQPEIGTQINNKLRLALKLLMNENKCYNYEEVSQRIEELGFEYKEMKFIESEYPGYKYSENILNNYVLENMEWSLKSGFKLPYKLKEEKKKNLLSVVEIPQVFNDSGMKEIYNVNEMITEINEFNKRYVSNVQSKTKFYSKCLEMNVMKNIKCEVLKEFVRENKLIERLKYYMK